MIEQRVSISIYSFVMMIIRAIMMIVDNNVIKTYFCSCRERHNTGFGSAQTTAVLAVSTGTCYIQS